MTLEARGTGCHVKNLFVHILLLHPFGSIVCYGLQEWMSPFWPSTTIQSCGRSSSLLFQYSVSEKSWPGVTLFSTSLPNCFWNKFMLTISATERHDKTKTPPSFLLFVLRLSQSISHNSWIMRNTEWSSLFICTIPLIILQLYNIPWLIISFPGWTVKVYFCTFVFLILYFSIAYRVFQYDLS